MRFSFFTKTFQLTFSISSCHKILPKGGHCLVFIYLSLIFHLYMGLCLGSAYIFYLYLLFWQYQNVEYAFFCSAKTIDVYLSSFKFFAVILEPDELQT